MSATVESSLQHWVAARQAAAAMLAGRSSGNPIMPAGATGVLADLLNELRRSPDPALASTREAQRALVARLTAAGIGVPASLAAYPPPPDYAAQFDDGFEGAIGPGCLRGVRARDGQEISIAGIAGAPLTAAAVAIIAESVLTSARQRPERPVLLVLDEGAALAVVDESQPLSEYLVHLARVLAWARSQAVAVNVWLRGGVTAPAYVACTASASRVVAFPDAVLCTQGAGRIACSAGAMPRQWLAVGLVDEVAAADRRVGIAWNASA
jgi:hypothetical protein